MPVFAGVPVAERILRLTNLRYDPVNNPPLTCASSALFCFPHSTSSLISELHPYDVAALALFRTRAPLSRMALSPYPDGPYLFVQIMKIVHELVRVVDILSCICQSNCLHPSYISSAVSTHAFRKLYKALSLFVAATRCFARCRAPAG